MILYILHKWWCFHAIFRVFSYDAPIIKLYAHIHNAFRPKIITSYGAKHDFKIWPANSWTYAYIHTHKLTVKYIYSKSFNAFHINLLYQGWYIINYNKNTEIENTSYSLVNRLNIIIVYYNIMLSKTRKTCNVKRHCLYGIHIKYFFFVPLHII